MRSKQLLLSILTVGLAFGTAWAIRGKFGHEQGAAWAGAIGALSVLLVAKRNDWYIKFYKIVLAAAFGWGISGVVSYGVVVGYGRGTDFVNVYYGLLMLFVIGLLYGFLGGGLFGLALVDSRETKVKWHSLLTEMIGMGLLTYSVLVYQLEWLMTPPRSEMWAACLGASIALGWYIMRNRHTSVLKVAACSAMGAGFGFAFGNFLHVMGNVSGINFNFWNVMEYSIGFFGGLGMAYGTFTSQWPSSESKVSPGSKWIAIIFLVLFIPFVVWDQSFVSERFDFILLSGGTLTTIFYMKLIAIVGIICVALTLILRNYSSSLPESTEDRAVNVKSFFILYTLLFLFLSFLVTGLYTHPLEQYLYLVNLAVILWLLPRLNRAFQLVEGRPSRWAMVSVVIVCSLAFFAFVAINSHGELPGQQVRFDL